MLAFFSCGFFGTICAGIMVDKFKKFKLIALGSIVLCKFALSLSCDQSTIPKPDSCPVPVFNWL